MIQIALTCDHEGCEASELIDWEEIRDALPGDGTFSIDPLDAVDLPAPAGWKQAGDGRVFCQAHTGDAEERCPSCGHQADRGEFEGWEGTHRDHAHRSAAFVVRCPACEALRPDQTNHDLEPEVEG